MTGSPSFQIRKRGGGGGGGGWGGGGVMGTKSNNSRCSISVCLRYASFQVLPSLCEIDSQCVENFHPVGIVVQTHARSLRCPRMPAPPPPYLLHQSPPRVLLFGFVCAPKTLISHVQFRDGFVAPTMKCPRSSSTPVIGHFLSLCSCGPTKVLFGHLL